LLRNNIQDLHLYDIFRAVYVSSHFVGFDADLIVVIITGYVILRQRASFRPLLDQRCTGGIMTSYQLSRRQPRRHNTTFDFVFVDFTIFEISKFVRKSNFF